MKKIKGVVSMTTWTDEDCGCSSSDDGWWVVKLGCSNHRGLVSRADRRNLRESGDQFGPIQPGGMKLVPRSQVDEEIASENMAIASLDRRTGR